MRVNIVISLLTHSAAQNHVCNSVIELEDSVFRVLFSDVEASQALGTAPARSVNRMQRSVKHLRTKGIDDVRAYYFPITITYCWAEPWFTNTN